MTDDEEEWYAPEPWGWLGNTLAILSFAVATAILYYAGWTKPKPPETIRVMTYNIPKTSEYCHPAKFYFTGYRWTCAR